MDCIAYKNVEKLDNRMTSIILYAKTKIMH